MSAFTRKYATATAAGTHICVPMIKAGTNDFATESDWTPVTGDVKVSINGGAQANITSLPSYANGQWIFTLSGAELTGKSITVAVVDTATKAVEDQFFIVETFGNASALYPPDFSDVLRFPTAAQITTAVLTDTTEADFTTANSPGAWLSGWSQVETVVTVATVTSATTFTVDSSASATTGSYVGQSCVFRTGALQGERRTISAYTGSTRQIVVSSAFSTTPTVSDICEVI